MARQQLSRCGDSLHLEEEVEQELFAFTRQVIYGDKKSSTMAEARANYLAYLVRHPTLKGHPLPLGHGWELVGGRCRPVRHTRPALPTHLPAPGPVEEDEEVEREEDEEDDVAQRRVESSESHDSESSDPECSDSD